MLCKACQQIFCGRQDLDKRASLKLHRHHPSLQFIIGASNSGCWICYRLLEAVREMEINEENSFNWRLEWRSEPKNSYQLWFYAGYKCLESLSLVPYYEYDGSVTNYAPIAGSDTMSDAALVQANKWYHECLSRHSACNFALLSKPYVPTRLLRVDEDQSYARLIITREEAVESSDYLTLSHCWGGLDILKLTSANLDTLKEGISLRMLPKTFVEAITVARKLSVSYIWIDSLCIIQDSIHDWQVESAFMDHVYSNSKLNIMAAVSKNSHEGLSRARDPRNLELCAEAESKWENAENDTFYLVNDVIWESAMNGAPLIKRGWVLQERILSPRSLHFCENELFWECREKIACETYPTGIPSICSNNSQSNIKIREPSESESYEKTHLVHGTSKAKKDVAYDRWATWVVLYSRAYLTKDSDKLVAISTLAKFTRTALDDVYVAGLWRSKFVDQLVWSSFHRNSRPTDNRAPSWSWASVNGEIYFASIMPNTQYQIEIDEVQVVPLSPVDVTGSVFVGFFCARGLLIRETLIQKPKYENLFYFSGDRHVPTYVKLDMPVEKYKAPVVVLPILNYSLRPEDNPSGYLPTQFQALILQPRAGSPNGFYTRIGLAQSDISFIKDERHGKLSAFRTPLRKLLRRDPVSSSKSHRFSRSEIGVNSGIDESLYLADSPGSFIVY